MDAAISKLAEYGAVGIALAAIIAACWITKMLLDSRKDAEDKAATREDKLGTIIGNHIDHATQAQTELSIAIKELSTIIREKIQ